MSRANSRVSRGGQESNRNKSNSNPVILNKNSTNGNFKQNTDNQRKIAPGLKILGQDREVTEDELFRESTTPISNRSSNSSRPASSASRATPSKQVSLQAVKRKEDKPEALEPIDWNEFNRALSLEEERVPPPVNLGSNSDSDGEYIVPRRVLSPEEEQALVEQRAREMASALDSSRVDKNEQVLSARLEEIEKERELQLKLDKAREEELMKSKLISDNDSKYSSDHYINISARDEKNKISKSFILGKESRQGTSHNEEMLKDKQKLGVRTGENVIGKHVMDRPQETAIAAASKNDDDSQESNKSEKVFVTEVKSESGKKNEASAKDDSSSDDDSDSDDDEDDLIGKKGKAPNQLLMEFVTCLMEKDYENAEKLCKMILIYEPDNKEALTFFPLIQEKREQDANDGESGEESTDSGEEEADDDDDDNDESGDDDDSDDDDDDDDDDESSEEDSDNDEPGHPDSGIASANSD